VLNPIENAITATATKAGSIFGIALFPVVMLATTCDETIHHGKPKASKMGASAKLEAPIAHGKNGCAKLNEKMGLQWWILESGELRGGQFIVRYAKKFMNYVKPRPVVALFRQCQ
jgi:hypothetical protein